MAISITWETGVIYVPRNDMPLIQVSPTEIRELDIDSFRLALKNLEASEYGMTFLDTHTNTGETLLGGLAYARIIEIINGYTVTFEDGQYAVNLFGANSNIGDVVNVNQVSVRSQNSAGLISNKAIEYASFEGAVWVDVVLGITSGTVYPVGTPQIPVNNLTDAAIIAANRGFTTIRVIGDLTITNVSSWENFSFIGDSQLKTTITVDANASVLNCEFYEATITGTLDGNSQIEKSTISGLDFVEGYIIKCSIGPSNIILGTDTTANILSCFSTATGSQTPIIDMNSTGILALRDYFGGIKLINYSGTGSHSIDLSSGQIKLDNTITSGTFVVRGIGKLIDINGDHIHSGTWNGGVTIINELLNVANIVEGTWDESAADHIIVGSMGEAQSVVGAVTPQNIIDIVDGVWDEAQADHLLVGTTGESLDDASVATPPGPTASEIVDAVWDEAQGNHLTAGSMGESQSIYGELSSQNIIDITDAVWDEAQADHLGIGSMGESQSVYGELTSQNIIDIVDATWDEAITAHIIPGSTGKALDTASIGSSLTPADVANAVWDETQAAHLTAGTMGKSLDDAATILTPTEIATAVWDALLTAHISPSTFGFAMNEILRDVSHNITSENINDETILSIWENTAQTILFKKYNIGTPEEPKRIDITP